MSIQRHATRRRLQVQTLELRQLMAGDATDVGGGEMLSDSGSTKTRFSSNHTDGANFCLGDGSVRFFQGRLSATAQSIDAAFTDDPHFFDAV